MFILNVVSLISNLTILTFSKVTDWHLLGKGGGYGLSYSGGGDGDGEVAQVGDKTQRWRLGGETSVRTQ